MGLSGLSAHLPLELLSSANKFLKRGQVALHLLRMKLAVEGRLLVEFDGDVFVSRAFFVSPPEVIRGQRLPELDRPQRLQVFGVQLIGASFHGEYLRPRRAVNSPQS